MQEKSGKDNCFFFRTMVLEAALASMPAFPCANSHPPRTANFDDSKRIFAFIIAQGWFKTCGSQTTGKTMK